MTTAPTASSKVPQMSNMDKAVLFIIVGGIGTSLYLVNRSGKNIDETDSLIASIKENMETLEKLRNSKASNGAVQVRSKVSDIANKATDIKKE